MTKAELAKRIRDNGIALTLAEIERCVDGLFDEITTELASGGKFTHTGFGTFSVKARAARKGRNPRTGEVIDVAPCTVVAFSAGKKLKEAVNS